MTRPLPVTEAELQAWVDGLLPEARRAEIDAYLAERPAEAARVAAYRRHDDALRCAFGPIALEPVPERLRLGAAPRRAAWMRRAAAAVAFACVGAAAGWTARSSLGGPASPPGAPQQVAAAERLRRQAVVAHAVYSPDARRPVEIGAEQEEQLVTWLSKRIGAKVRPAQLSGLGYELIGGRLLPGASGPVAQFMYRDRAGQRLTLYVAAENAANRDTAFRFAQEGPINVFYWIDGRFGYAISAGIDRAELARVATEVYRQIAS